MTYVIVAGAVVGTAVLSVIVALWRDVRRLNARLDLQAADLDAQASELGQVRTRVSGMAAVDALLSRAEARRERKRADTAEARRRRFRVIRGGGVALPFAWLASAARRHPISAAVTAAGVAVLLGGFVIGGGPQEPDGEGSPAPGWVPPAAAAEAAEHDQDDAGEELANASLPARSEPESRPGPPPARERERGSRPPSHGGPPRVREPEPPEAPNEPDPPDEPKQPDPPEAPNEPDPPDEPKQPDPPEDPGDDGDGDGDDDGDDDDDDGDDDGGGDDGDDEDGGDDDDEDDEGELEVRCVVDLKVHELELRVCPPGPASRERGA